MLPPSKSLHPQKDPVSERQKLEHKRPSIKKAGLVHRKKAAPLIAARLEAGGVVHLTDKELDYHARKGAILPGESFEGLTRTCPLGRARRSKARIELAIRVRRECRMDVRECRGTPCLAEEWGGEGLIWEGKGGVFSSGLQADRGQDRLAPLEKA